MSLFEQIVQLIISGLIIGSTYALVAASLGIVFSTTRIFHLAHSVVYTIAPYVAVNIIALLSLPLWAGILVGLVASVIMGVGIEKIVYAPLRKRKATTLVLFLASLGFQILGTNLIRIVFGPRNQILSGISNTTIAIGNVTFTAIETITVVVSWIVIGLLLLFLKRSMYGRAITAVRSNSQMAMSVGISVKRVYTIVFVIGSLLAGLAALLFTLDGVAYSTMGIAIVLTAFVAVFLGGVDSVGGAAISGLILGLISSLCSLFMPSDFAPVVVFGLMYIILVFRPRGLFGKKAA